MTDDLIKRAEATLEVIKAPIIADLLTALKAARAQRDQDLEAFAKNYVHITNQLEAARAENERLKADCIPLTSDGDCSKCGRLIT